MKYLYYLALLLTAGTITAQKVKLKKEIIYVEDAPTFSFDKKMMGNELHIYKLNTKEELITITVDNNKTESKVDDSKNITFVQQNTNVQTLNFRGRDYEFLIALILEEKVINLKGEINPDNLVRFKAKYDDRNINHTMMR